MYVHLNYMHGYARSIVYIGLDCVLQSCMITFALLQNLVEQLHAVKNTLSFVVIC